MSLKARTGAVVTAWVDQQAPEVALQAMAAAAEVAIAAVAEVVMAEAGLADAAHLQPSNAPQPPRPSAALVAMAAEAAAMQVAAARAAEAARMVATSTEAAGADGELVGAVHPQPSNAPQPPRPSAAPWPKRPACKLASPRRPTMGQERRRRAIVPRRSHHHWYHHRHCRRRHPLAETRSLQRLGAVQFGPLSLARHHLSGPHWWQAPRSRWIQPKAPFAQSCARANFRVPSCTCGRSAAQRVSEGACIGDLFDHTAGRLPRATD